MINSAWFDFILLNFQKSYIVAYKLKNAIYILQKENLILIIIFIKLKLAYYF